MQTRTARTETARTLLTETVRSLADFLLGGLPMIGAVGGVLTLVLVPMWLACRALGIM